jgi:hypothetical protein
LAKRILLILLFLMACTSPTFAEIRWIGKAEGTKLLGKWVKDVSGPPRRGYWAGEVTEIEIDAQEAGFTLTGRIKVKITWVTDRTSYKCHEIYLMNAEDVEDFEYRSLMLTQCQ